MQETATTTDTLKNYFEVTKPPIVFLLVFTSVATMIIAWKDTLAPLTPTLLIVATVAIAAASAGCDTLTSYVDRDIDAVMRRTRKRPIPSGRIAPRKALRGASCCRLSGSHWLTGLILFRSCGLHWASSTMLSSTVCF